MEQFNDATLNTLRAELTDAVRVIGAKHGLNISLGRFNYDNYKTTIKLTSVINSPAAAAKLAPPAWVPIGKEFMFNGERFRVVGYKERSFKYPITAVSVVNGKSFNFKSATVLSTPAL